jgi:hypothetical protein
LDFGWYVKAPLEAAFVKIKSLLLGGWQSHVHMLSPPILCPPEEMLDEAVSWQQLVITPYLGI